MHLKDNPPKVICILALLLQTKYQSLAYLHWLIIFVYLCTDISSISLDRTLLKDLK